MSKEEKKINSEGVANFAELDNENKKDEVLENPVATDDLMTSATDKNEEADEKELAASSDQFENDSADYSDDANAQDASEFSGEDENAVAMEFNAMDNVINGKQRKQRKKRKKMSKRGKMIEYVAIACVCVALLSVLAYFGAMFLGGETKTQGFTGADVIVDMEDCDFYFGTVNQVDLTKTFPGGTGFKLVESPAGVTLRGGTQLQIAADSGTETFELTFTSPSGTDGTATVEKKVSCKVVETGVNVATWDLFKKTTKENSIVVLQDDIACPPLKDLKRADNSTIILKNDLYGNGKIVNLFELVCCRTKANSKKYGEPYLLGNGKTWGTDGISVANKVDDPENPVLLQDVHLTGNDMSQVGPTVSEGEEGVEAAPVAEGEGETQKVGNLYGLSDDQVKNRGVLLFSKYGSVLSLVGGEDKLNVDIKHCVIENGGKVVHIRNSNVNIEGTIVRNAADTAISVGTYANDKSVIYSKNNVIANSLTGGVLFYCFDSDISEANAEETWNEFYIDGFLDIYNWKEQKSLAFLPETEDFANIANPIAGSEIPKSMYNPLKGQDEAGNYYIHFAIIKIRTGGGLPMNGSQVYGYENIGYSTAKENGFENGFPIPGIATAIMKDIDVWGYYGESAGAVTPTKKLGGETDEDLKFFYSELKPGYERQQAQN